jgi:signal transduction histidine kinase
MLLRQVLGMPEADWARIARELHEAVGQTIASLAVAVRVADTETTVEELKQRVAEAPEPAVELTEDVRRLATEMRPRTLEAWASDQRWSTTLASLPRGGDSSCSTTVRIQTVGDYTKTSRSSCIR